MNDELKTKLLPFIVHRSYFIVFLALVYGNTISFKCEPTGRLISWMPSRRW
jgi:hypothetical protein